MKFSPKSGPLSSYYIETLAKCRNSQTQCKDLCKLLTCSQRPLQLMSWRYGKQLSLKVYLVLFCFATIHIRVQTNFVFWRITVLPQWQQLLSIKDKGPVTQLTLSFANFGAKFLVVELSSSVKGQRRKGESYLWRELSLQHRVSWDASISFFNASIFFLFYFKFFFQKTLDHWVCPVKNSCYEILFSSELLWEFPMLSM